MAVPPSPDAPLEPTLHAVGSEDCSPKNTETVEIHFDPLSPASPISAASSTLPEGLLASERESSSKSIEPGQRIGRYLTEEILGRGGMGLVLRARDDLLQRQVAIKVILPQYLSIDPTAGLRFLREAEIVASLTHPHIISLLDAGLDDGIAFLAFSYVSGLNYSKLRRQGPLSLERTVDLLLPVISAVAYAHRAGVVHGDIKPTNIILGEDYRSQKHPWILDFGVSFFSHLDAGLDPTRGRVSGTPGYLAPERVDSSSIDNRSDCFSLGCVFYELLVGSGPFSRCQRISEAVTAAKSYSYPKVSTLCDVPAAIDEVIRKALEAEPSERFQSALELGRALLPFASPALQNYYGDEFLSNN